jgi:hypothetical protein
MIDEPPRWYRCAEEKARELHLVYQCPIEVCEDGGWRAFLTWEQFWNDIVIKTRH